MIVSDENAKRKGIELINSWRADWNKFAREALGVILDKEQQEILAAVQTSPRVSVASGTSRGKDFVAACAALSFLYLTPRWGANGQLVSNTKVALTAPTDRQVTNIMMPEVSRLYYKAKARGVILPGKLYTYGIRTFNKEWFLTGFKADNNNREAWSGFHAVNTMFVVTEGSGISENIFDAIEGNLQGNSRILIVFNPNTPVGYAARSQKSERWKRFRLNSLTAPNVTERRMVIPGQVDYDWVTDKLQQWCIRIGEHEVQPELDDFFFEGQWYRPEDLFRVKVQGKFPKVSDDILIPVQWIEQAVQRWRDAGGEPPCSVDSPVMGVDVAGMGRDATVKCRRWGDFVFPFEVYNTGTPDHMRTAGEIVAECRRNSSLRVAIDTIGEGAGVYSRCVEVLDGKDAANVISCKYSYGTGAREWGRELTDITGQYRFANLRAWLFWQVRDWLNPKNNTGAMLPPDDALLEEASEIRWFFRSDGSVIIEQKEDIKHRLGRSTDRFDALANTFYPQRGRKAIDLARIARKAYF